MAATGRIVIADLRGGRNGDDPPHLLGETQCVEALNVDWFEGGLARKRNGAADQSLSGSSFSAAGEIYQAFPYRSSPPSADTMIVVGVNELADVVANTFDGSTWASITTLDAFAPGGLISAAQFNGKLFLGYNSAGTDRLHCYDGTSIRRTGLVTPSAPTAADTGSGTYTATIRYYKYRWVQVSGSDTVRVSELSSAYTFTPSGSGTHARVSRHPIAPGEGETHWDVYGSADDGAFYKLSRIAIASTTYDDNAAPSSYSANEVAPSAGTHTNFPSLKYLLATDNRLFGAGNYIGTRQSRIYFSAALGSTDIGDDERTPNTSTLKYYVDVGENDRESITGLGGPLRGVILAFKQRSVWQLQATGDSTNPYTVTPITRTVGCKSHWSIVNGEDEAGFPCVYFLAEHGPHRLGRNGIEDIGRGMLDLWATYGSPGTSFTWPGLYYPARHQVWWSIGGGTGTITIVYHIQTGGWSYHVPQKTSGAAGSLAAIWSFAMAQTESDSNLTPYYTGENVTPSTGFLRKADTGTTDGGTAFQAYVDTKVYAPAGLGQTVTLEAPTLCAEANNTVSLVVRYSRNYGKETQEKSVRLATSSGETRVLKKADGLELADCAVAQVRIGDAAAISNAWTVDHLCVPWRVSRPI